jgi:hypothetical protein
MRQVESRRPPIVGSTASGFLAIMASSASGVVARVGNRDPRSVMIVAGFELQITDILPISP